MDNDLSDEYEARLGALTSGWRPGMEVWVYADTPKGASLSRLEGRTEGVQLRTVESYGQENSASGAVLGRVLRTVWERCPAEGYGLLFFSHATGWLPQGTLERPSSATASVSPSAGTASRHRMAASDPVPSSLAVSTDDRGLPAPAFPADGKVAPGPVSGSAQLRSSGPVLSPSSASAPVPGSALSLATQPRGSSTRSVGRDGSDEIAPDEFASAIPAGMPLEYIVFEACLMAGAEVAMELSGRTQAVLASSAELLVPGFRPVYDEGLELLTSRRGSAAEALAAFGRRYMEYVRSECTGVYRSATLSVIRPDAMPALAAATREATAGGAGDMAPAGWLEPLQRFDRPGQYGDRPAAARFFDLEEYVSLLAAQSGTGEEATARFRTALSEAVVWSDATEEFMGGVSAGFGGFRIAHHSGLTTYVPRAEFPGLNDAYTGTAWWRAVNSNGI